ncbi:hypothetical protein AVEN_143341-1 [Araneus ventricosus]|uniref:Uncharacterized protein n=1 Tax=Araneus ventricosus TaxID=182803 RepID=A0A4Y2ADV5_ARAVE|nr:hypothetical protein AVEN_143341-1 [Araneus ventricosus]
MSEESNLTLAKARERYFIAIFVSLQIVCIDKNDEGDEKNSTSIPRRSCRVGPPEAALGQGNCPWRRSQGGDKIGARCEKGWFNRCDLSILLTLTTTGERRVSSLKLIKSYLAVRKHEIVRHSGKSEFGQKEECVTTVQRHHTISALVAWSLRKYLLIVLSHILTVPLEEVPSSKNSVLE